MLSSFPCRACAVDLDHTGCFPSLFQLVAVWAALDREEKLLFSCLCFCSYSQGCWGTWLLPGCTPGLCSFHWLPIPQVFPCRASPQPVCPEPVSLPDSFPSQGQDSAFVFAESHEPLVNPLLQPQQAPLKGRPTAPPSLVLSENFTRMPSVAS